MNRNALLGNFLRSRRARLSPNQVGLPDRGRRRTPGLRREEVAEMAFVSTTWYTWLEQGRNVGVSVETLTYLGHALQLDADETDHLFALAGLPLPLRETPPVVVEPAVRSLLDALEAFPAYAFGPCMDILAWNSSAIWVLPALSSTPQPGLNLLRLLFTPDPSSDAILNRQTYAEYVVAEFRVRHEQGLVPETSADLLNELQQSSPEFRQIWSRHDVSRSPDLTIEVRHPQMGLKRFRLLRLLVDRSAEVMLDVLTPESDVQGV